MKLIILLLTFLTMNLMAEESNLKTKDYQNKEADSSQNAEKPEISAEQLKELQKNVETIKENEKKANEYMKELDKDL